MKKIKRMLSLLIVLTFLFSFSVSAYAAEYDLTVGDVSVSADDTGTYVTQTNTEFNNYKDETPVVITSGGVETANTVSIASEGDAVAEVTLGDVNINTGADKSAVDIADGSTVEITLKGDNTLKTGGEGEYDENGDWLSEPEQAVLHVKDADLTLQGDGSLMVRDDYSYSLGAGIGSHDDEDFSGSITITGDVSVDVKSGGDGAGIGAGEGGDFNGKVTIDGNAYVKADSDSDGAGIGAGQDGDFSGTISIGGNAVVETESENDGAAIGAGEDGNFTQDGTVNIGGKAQVVADGDEDGSGIGAGQDGDFSGTINIGGEAQVEAWSEYSGAGIGAGESGSFTGTVNITGGEDGGPTVEAWSGQDGAGIGSGEDGDFSGTVNIVHAAVKAESVNNNEYDEYEGPFGNGAGIGAGAGGDFTQAGLVCIEDSEVTACSDNEGTAIGAPDYSDFNGSIVVRGDSSLALYDHFRFMDEDSLLGNGYDSNGGGYVVLDETAKIFDILRETLLTGEDLENAIGAERLSYEDWLALRQQVPMQDFFWQDVLRQLRAAEKGAEITVDAGKRTTIPAFVLEAVARYEVTLLIQWDGGEDITIHKDFVPEKEAEVYKLADLAEQLKK